MRKIIFIYLSLFSVLFTVEAQFTTNDISVKATEQGVTLNNLDEAFFFNGITPNSTSITFTYSTTTPTTIKWYRYVSSPSATAPFFLFQDYATSSKLILPNVSTPGYNTAIDNGDKCGYIIEYDDGLVTKYKYIWVYDIKNDLLKVDSLIADNNSVDPCFSTHISVKIDGGDIEYYNSLGVKNTIPRKFNLTYYSLDSLNINKTVLIQKTDLVNGMNSFTVPAPYKTTKFTLEGDQFCKALNDPRTSTTVVDYIPVAVQANLKAVVAERDALNEKDRSLPGSIGGSARLVVDFTSNANIPIAQYFEWYIKNSADTTDVAYYTDKNLRYTFEETGLYSIKLKVSNSVCSVTDSTYSNDEKVVVNVVESFLEVPNVFTPNGDGKNDEFRVAFKSIVKFRGIVYNRWGRKIFEWNDPGKGWNGRIGGKLAQPGAYYYIIEAQGSDIDPETKKPQIYILNGDINLIRGK